MKKIAAFVASLAIATLPISASAITFTTNSGPTSNVAGVNYVVDFESGVPTVGFASYQSIVGHPGGQAFEIWGPSLNPQMGMNNLGNYLAVGSGATFSMQPNGWVEAADYQLEIRLSSLTDYFGFEWGSMDWYNDIYFYNGETTVGTFTGNSEVLPGFSPRLPDNTTFITTAPHATAQMFVNFFANNPNEMFDRIRMVSSSAFETDNHSFRLAEVPEPTSVLLLGMGALGALRARRRKVSA